MSDFVSNEPIEVDIDGRIFKIKEVSGEEADLIANAYIKIKDENTLDIDIAAKSREWLKHTVMDAPYDLSGKPFTELNPDQRVSILQQLKPAIRSKLLKEIYKINEPPSDIKKN